MRVWSIRIWLAFLLLVALTLVTVAQVATQANSSSSKSKKSVKTPAENSGIDAGIVTNGVYHNKWLALSCKIPAGWVLRTEEMNAREEGADSAAKSSTQRTQGNTEEGNGGRVLLAAFSRPPDAKGEEVNASILIAVESAASYPGLTDAGQYFGPLAEVAKAQGLEADEEPYEIAIGTKTLVRGDFHKNVGSRVMRQSTLAFLARGEVVSITVIGGTEDEVEELIDGLSFAGK